MVLAESTAQGKPARATVIVLKKIPHHALSIRVTVAVKLFICPGSQGVFIEKNDDQELREAVNTVDLEQHSLLRSMNPTPR